VVAQARQQIGNIPWIGHGARHDHARETGRQQAEVVGGGSGGDEARQPAITEQIGEPLRRARGRDLRRHALRRALQEAVERGHRHEAAVEQARERPAQAALAHPREEQRDVCIVRTLPPNRA
jgi:hypothetical protein